MKIYCVNENCSSRDSPDPIDVSEILLKVVVKGKVTGYKCPYCRGDQFRLCE